MKRTKNQKNHPPGNDTIVHQLNDVYDALREIQLMTAFLGRASTVLLNENSDEFMLGGRFLFDCINYRFEQILDDVQVTISEVKQHGNLTEAH